MNNVPTMGKKPETPAIGKVGSLVDVIGIDPGIKGGIAHVQGRVGSEPTLVSAYLMPVMADPAKVYSTGKMIDVKRLVLSFFLPTIEDYGVRMHDDTTGAGRICAVIERAQAMPKQGVVSVFNYGFNYGIVIGQLRVFLGNDLRAVRPNIWKRDLNLIGKNKTSSRALATKIFGESKWEKKSDDGVAEAALIAYWQLERICRVQMNQLTPQ